MVAAVDWLEWTGSVSGLLGAFLLATHTSVSRYGWFAFLVANLSMGVFALDIHHYGLLMQQVGFTFTSLLGIYRTGFLSSGSRQDAMGPSLSPSRRLFKNRF